MYMLLKNYCLISPKIMIAFTYLLYLIQIFSHLYKELIYLLNKCTYIYYLPYINSILIL